MIIVGYPGVGKSTLAKKYPETYIDLESSVAREEYGENWEEKYISTASLLSDIGFHVFVSCHKSVRDVIKKRNLKVISIFPAWCISDSWINKLKERYDKTKLEKDFKAYDRANKYILADILHLKEDSDEVFTKLIIKDINYNLEEILNLLLSDLEIASNAVSKQSTKYDFIWGISKDIHKEASFNTSNIVEVVFNKEDKRYYITIEHPDGFISIKEEYNYYNLIIDAFSGWVSRNVTPSYAVEEHELSLNERLQTLSAPDLSQLLWKLKHFLSNF